MEHAKLAKGNERKPIGRSSTSARRKAAQKKAESARPLRKETGKSKSDKLVCRYCGSSDLAPSSSSGGIADAANVSANAMDQRHERGRRKLSNSFTTTVR
jgi:hypothetical protein